MFRQLFCYLQFYIGNKYKSVNFYIEMIMRKAVTSTFTGTYLQFITEDDRRAVETCLKVKTVVVFLKLLTCLLLYPDLLALTEFKTLKHAKRLGSLIWGKLIC